MFTSLILAVSLGIVPSAAAADPVPVLPDDADVAVDYDLVVDLENAEIDVDMTVDITYKKPSIRNGNQVTHYRMVEWHAFVPSSAVDISASDPIGELPYVVEDLDQPGVVVVKVDFRRDLSTGQSIDLELSYSLPSEPPPIALDETVGLILEDQVVVNEATVGWAFYSDPRADDWYAEIELPPGFVGPVNDSEVFRQREGTSTLQASGDAFVYDFIIIENDSAMSESNVQFGDDEITVRHWPGDTEWQQRVSDQITGNLPRLIDLVGSDWPDRPLVVQQSAQTLGTSYGGWYTGGDHRITIGRSINPELVLHELSHVWFQYDNLDDRWLIEGLADEFASLTVDGTEGGDEPDVSLDDEHAINLKDWSDPQTISGAQAPQPEAERWAYQAAWHTIRVTRRTIGVEAFTAVTRAILDGARSYPGPEVPGDGPRSPRGWQEFLDLASAYDTDGELAEFYAEWVEGSWTTRFQQRAEARQHYAELVDRTGGGTPPVAVRNPMRAWSFTEAGRSMNAAEAFLDQVDELTQQLTAVDVDVPADLWNRFAVVESVDELGAYQAELTSATGRIENFARASAAVNRWQRIGLIGSDFDATRIAAIDAFESGNLAEAAELTTDGETLLEDAATQGRRRAAIGAGAALVIISGLMWVVRHRRRSPRHPVGRGPVIDLRTPSPDPDESEVVESSAVFSKADGDGVPAGGEVDGDGDGDEEGVATRRPLTR